MSEHRRKPPQPQGGGRAAARRAAQQPSGRRAAPWRDAAPGPGNAAGSGSDPYGRQSPYGGRAEARRAAQRGGRRRTSETAAMASDGGRGGRGGGRRAGGGGGRDGGRGGGRPGKRRLIDYPRAGRFGWRRFVPSWKQVLGTCVGFLGLLVGAAGIALAYVDVPDPQKAASLQKNVYYWADGKPMVVAGGGDLNRQIVPLSSIPKSMQNAVIAAENASFWDDSGVDPMGIARAVLNMAKGGETQSGSTITQQYVKNMYLDQSQTIKRKVTELFISVKVGMKEDKHDILKGYLNTAYYGRGAYGIQAASRAYYDKDCDKLTPSEGAFLATLLNGPNLYDPYITTETKGGNRQRAETRWKWILDREVEVGSMSKAARAKITEFPNPRKPKKAMDLRGQKGYLVDLANNYITTNTDISDKLLKQGGYEIHTTFDRKKVEELTKAVERVTKEHIKPDQREVDKYVQFGGASVEPGTGKIVAIYGGKDATQHYTNNADFTGVQVGSTFKPFVLAAAMDKGVRDPRDPSTRTRVSPSSVYNGNNKLKLLNYDGTVWHDKDGQEWHQRNDGNESRGRISLRTAMQYSVNTPYIQLGMDVGTETVKQAAIDAGLRDDRSMAKTTPTYSLGTSAPSAIRLAGAYATFAASGQQDDPYSVESVEKDGREVYKHVKKPKTGFSPAVADNVTDVLKTVVEKGTGTAAQLPDGREVAGKTGTTDDNKSAWFAGYTKQLATTIGMWRVDDQAKHQKFEKMYGVGGEEKIHGASFPARIWADYMTEAMQGKPLLPFPKPGPIGQTVYGEGMSPSPTPPPVTTPPTTSPSPTQSHTTPPATTSPSPTPTETCSEWNVRCRHGHGGDTTSNGGGNGGRPGGGTGGETTPPSEPPPGNNDAGGLFGGPDDGGQDEW
ncbi:transglycosylase domain-containing protein [Streptomyces sp. MST-110588]|uniref:transglycosylase domain-containing protein n=1 Tax=Streptomyces sp. MST-110588 TaxID=2833628 RepID=UPI001F5E0E29|nr:transglycosylase domain-containing protein [Streptomyces sp. MST-110588]UNO40944.1 penicillin-binding protein [Streptomyces sp. MST-110588]